MAFPISLFKYKMAIKKARIVIKSYLWSKSDFLT